MLTFRDYDWGCLIAVGDALLKKGGGKVGKATVCRKMERRCRLHRHQYRELRLSYLISGAEMIFHRDNEYRTGFADD